MQALLYASLDPPTVRCHLCHHRCRIKDGKRGLCGVRQNRAGTLQTLVYGRLIARNVDPIEKKPLFHFQPGSRTHSIATVGCNFTCRFCQNADIAQMPSGPQGRVAGQATSPEQEVGEALASGCASIAFTYTEPTVYFEFALDTARLARRHGMKTVFVTNGYQTPEALEMIVPFLDAANVDLKAFTDDFYRRMCGARLAPVKETLKWLKSRGVWVEVTTLVIPGLNDAPDELEALAAFLVSDLGPDTPWHISRFHPTYRLTDRPPTPVSTLTTARDIGISAGLHHVYTGNVPGETGESTYCQRCRALLIDRWGFSIRNNRIRKGLCPDCGQPIGGIEMASARKNERRSLL
jgi:pyruvate formate lyase activating enzyme